MILTSKILNNGKSMFYKLLTVSIRFSNGSRPGNQNNRRKIPTSMQYQHGEGTLNLVLNGNNWCLSFNSFLFSLSSIGFNMFQHLLHLFWNKYHFSFLIFSFSFSYYLHFFFLLSYCWCFSPQLLLLHGNIFTTFLWHLKSKCTYCIPLDF